MFWKVTEGPEDQAGLIYVCAGTLDPPTGLTTEGAIFVADAADYHGLDPTLDVVVKEAGRAAGPGGASPRPD